LRAATLGLMVLVLPRGSKAHVMRLWGRKRRFRAAWRGSRIRRRIGCVGISTPRPCRQRRFS